MDRIRVCKIDLSFCQIEFYFSQIEFKLCHFETSLCQKGLGIKQEKKMVFSFFTYDPAPAPHPLAKDQFKISQLTSRDTNFQCGTSRLPLSYISQVESMSHHKMHLQRASQVVVQYSQSSSS